MGVWGRRGDSERSDARGAKPLWKFAKQIWILGRRPESLLLRLVSDGAVQGPIVDSKEATQYSFFLRDLSRQVELPALGQRE